MRGEWNGLKALVSNNCPYAYYIHCLAHHLQLALVVASKEVILVQSFYNRLSTIVNVVGASCKLMLIKLYILLKLVSLKLEKDLNILAHYNKLKILVGVLT